MKLVLSTTVFLFILTKGFAQKDSLDLVIYKPLKGWQKKDQQSVRTYSFVNKDKSWCQIAIYKSTTSKGNINADFESEWNELVAKPFKPVDAPEKSQVEEADGWKILAGSGKFIFNDSNTAVLLTTFSGYNRCVSIVATTPNQRFLQNIIDFIGTIELKKPGTTGNDMNTIASNDLGPDNTQRKDGYAFNTTNFDDGWRSVIKEDWVETTKGNIKVLLHYPKEGTVFAADPAPLTNAAWNILVAPRYSNLKNYRTTYISAYNRPTLGMGYATENATGKNVFVLLFRQSEGWIEFVTPDKNSFIEQFKIDPETIDWNSNSDVVNPLAAMKGYNKFAVAASDINSTGKWNDHFASNTYYTNVYTGMSAGMSTYSSSQWFEFGAGNTYKWQLVAANSYGGVSKFAQAKGAGTFKMLNNWQIYFSDIEGKPKTYDVYFTANKGGRVLWMNDAEYKGSGIFTGYTKE